MFLAAACGGNGAESERVLVLGGGDYTEVEFRSDVRALFVALGSDGFCNGPPGVSDEEIADWVSAARESAGGELNQTPEPADRVRAGAIFREECERITSK